MARTWLTILILLVVVVLLWTVFEGAPDRTPPAPPGAEALDEEPTHPLLPALEGPFPSLVAGPDEGERPLEAKVAGGPPDPEREQLLALAGVAMQRAGVVLKGTLDIDAYLHGGGTLTGERIEVPPEIVDKLFDLLKTAPPDQKLKVAVALAVVKLKPEEIDELARRLEVEMAVMKDEATKNVVLGLSYALSAQGDSRGTSRLADALRTGEGSEVANFRRGAVLILAIAEDEASSPLLRELLAVDPDRLVRKNSAIGLGKIGGDENAEALALALSSEQDLEVRAWSALARGRSSVTKEGAGDTVLFQALKEDPDGEVRAAAAYAYATTGGPEVLDTLVNTWYGEDHEFARVGLAAGIARHGDRAQVADFLDTEASRFLTDSVVSSDRSLVRFYSAVTLGMLPPSPERSSALHEAVSNERSDWVRIGAVDALVKTDGQAAKEFLEAELASETSERMTRHLEATLGRLSKK